MNNRMLEKYVSWFMDYTQEYINRDKGIDQENFKLKQDHSLRVLDESRQILHHAGLDPALNKVTMLAALFHDVGRFEQYRRFGTFNDRVSLDHGLQGFKVLTCCPFLQSLSHVEKKILLYTVLWHNKRSLPIALPLDYAQVLSVIRDADKLDIISVLLAYMENGSQNNVVTLGLKDDPGCFSLSLLNSLLQGQGVDYQTMVWVNDFRLLLLSWYFAFNFPWSRDEMVRRGYINRLLAGLPAHPEVRRVRRMFVSLTV